MRSVKRNPDTVTAHPATLLGDLLESRFSCRGYRPEPVPHDTIVRLLEIAQLSPSWCNSQPWNIIVTEGAGTERFRSALHAYAISPDAARTPDVAWPARYEGIYKERQRSCGWALYEAVGIAHGDRAASVLQAQRNFDFFGAPHTAIITTERDLGAYGAIDCGIYVANFLLAAEALGLGAIAQAALAMYSGFVRDYFDILDNRQILCGISFGYPDRDHPANGFRTLRAPIAEVVRWATD